MTPTSATTCRGLTRATPRSNFLSTGRTRGGIATPFIAHWPKGIPAGRRITSPAHLIDVMATCVDVAQTPYPQEYEGNKIQPLEGESLRPAFTNDAWSR